MCGPAALARVAVTAVCHLPAVAVVAVWAVAVVTTLAARRRCRTLPCTVAGVGATLSTTRWLPTPSAGPLLVLAQLAVPRAVPTAATAMVLLRPVRSATAMRTPLARRVARVS